MQHESRLTSAIQVGVIIANLKIPPLDYLSFNKAL